MRGEPGAAATVWGGDAARDPRLDGLRGLAIALVLLYHTTQFGFAEGPAARALVALPALGWSGVDLFFVLSGFLITGLLLRAEPAPRTVGAFYARRALRILPLYWTALLFFLVLVPRLPGLDRIDAWFPGAAREGWWFWAFLSNVQLAFEGRQHRFLDIAWSLAIEEHFYLVWPWVVLRTSERGLLRVCAAAAVLAFALRVALVWGAAPPLAPYVLTPCRFDALATGAALAVVARRGGLAQLAPVARRALPLAAAAFAACCAWARFAGGEVAAGALAFHAHPLVQTAGYTLLCLLWGALLVVVATAPAGGLAARVFERPWLRGLGQHAYGLYLFHVFVAALAFGLPFVPARQPGWFVPAQLALWATAIGASVAVARMAWLAIERPALSLKRYFPVGGRDAMPAGR